MSDDRQVNLDRQQVDAFSAPDAPLVPTNRERTVFVVHGRDKRARREFFTFLRAIGLHPYEWTEVLARSKQGAPYIGDMLAYAMSAGQAVVVLLTPDDIAHLKSEHADGEDDSDLRPTGQARPNVLFEAGMAFGRFPDRTILVELGRLRPFTDIGGRYIVRLDNTVKRRQTLALLLRETGCAVHLDGVDWHSAGDLTPPGAAPTTAEASTYRNGSGEPGEPASFHKVVVKANDRGWYNVLGEVVSHRSEDSTLIIEATFYDADGKILGAASGAVSGIGPGRMKNFQLLTRDDVGAYTEVRMQVANSFP